MTEQKLGSLKGEKLPPQHIAIIMDGNGRWAKSRRLPRSSGHQKGVQSVRKIVKHCGQLGVNTLTLFAFSSENLNRPSEEVGLLFKLFLTVLKNETTKLNDNNIKLKIIGDLSVFTPEIQRLANDAEKQLSNNNGLNLVIAANYGGRWDIVESAKKIAIKSVNGELDPEKIDTSLFNAHSSLAEFPKVDLLIRTSGELRISNFLLWEIAYSELYFCNTLWPDFDEHELDTAIESFHLRERRFGKRNGEK
ncbi:MAG: polyprenyl diphosphate synthase [SAR86 cluster bacterium]|jgi:undecaprenyl diphosphate synthase|nr:di-trans,poly-cis-decaprenylcistransferase [Candidatus Pseudothioglobus aerophilus]MBT3439878.1 di-trans,poly-cis-decaprenylcistransferase [Gammaproteobacteria bacterium]MDO7577349.1 polyprenyl diphosphate synthase [SAR86 cluster bacterium]MDP0559724.1 polyprenyl diphosphate synthase [Candidatus Thioglobus sp.]MBT4244971.1 di-trans,poly-cis-decaprenylcistransferase [Gammaproteobacteria bacterium]